MILDNAVYVGGERQAARRPLAGTYRACRKLNGFAWVDLHEPSAGEFASMMREFEPHHLALADANRAHQRPKIERSGDLTFAVLKTARYLEEPEAVEIGEVRLFVGADFVFTVSLGDPTPVREARRLLEAAPERLRRGPEAVLHVLLGRVVGGYAPVVEGLENDIEEIEDEVFGGRPGVSRRIYELYREVIQFQRATKPLGGVVGSLILEEPDREEGRRLRDLEGQTLRVAEQVEDFRELLTSILNVNLTLIGIDQNDQTKKISAWAAILIVPTLIAGIYGMNFEYMPELYWPLGYPFALSLMALVALLLYRAFRRSGWL
jgi:magnesium transporter